MVVVLETGGRWSAEALSFIEEMAQARARDAPFPLRRSALGMEETVDQNVLGLLRQVVRLFLGCRSARRNVGGRWSDT